MTGPRGRATCFGPGLPPFQSSKGAFVDDNRMPGQYLPTWAIVTAVVVLTLFFALVILSSI